jgi:regulator of sigma E protease
LIFVHEFGHFILAKRGGVKVIEFAIGFGPKLIKIQRGETLYTVRAFPIGGFCRFLSEHADLKPDLDEGKMTQQEYERLQSRSFESKGYGRRMAVISGGSIANFLLGAIMFILLYAVWGQPTFTGNNVISDVVLFSPANQAGLVYGDRIVSVDGQPTPDWKTLISVISAAQGQHPAPDDPQQGQDQQPGPGQQQEPQQNQQPVQADQQFNPMVLSVQKPDGSLREIVVTPEYDPKSQRALIGIVNEYTLEKVSPLEALKLGAAHTIEFTKTIASILFGLVTKGEGADGVGGPVLIAQVLGERADEGFHRIWAITAALSIQLGLLNLLPLPALDGGQIVFMTYERIRGKEMKPEVKGLIQLVGFALIMMLIVAVLFRDVFRIFS